jgi:hypothetical protein
METCSPSLYLFYCQVILHVSGVSRTHHQEHTKCSYNHWYRSWIWRCSDKIRLKSPWTSRDAVISSLCLFYCRVTLHISGVSRTHHQEHTNCSNNHWYRSWIWRWPWSSEVAARPWTLFKQILSLHSPNFWLVPVVVTTACVLLMMGAGDTRNM